MIRLLNCERSCDPLNNISVNQFKGAAAGERPVVWQLHVYIEEEKLYIKENAKQFKSPATHSQRDNDLFIFLWSETFNDLSIVDWPLYMRDIRSAYYKQGKWNMKLELLSNDT